MLSKLCPLFSGSRGNCVYIGHSGEGILIDAGRSARQLEKSLINNDINIKNIKAIFITHEHNDHISGLKIFASRYGIKVYASKGTLLALHRKGVIDGTFPYEVITQKGVDVGNMQINAFRTSHDCSESVGYSIRFSDGTKAVVCTDLGFISSEVENAIDGCNALVIESNYDIEMLKNGDYPYYLKRRILSEKGHLSNEECAGVLPRLVKNGLTRIVLSHLSLENNTPALAFRATLEVLKTQGMVINKDFTLNIAPQINEENLKLIF